MIYKQALPDSRGMSEATRYMFDDWERIDGYSSASSDESWLVLCAEGKSETVCDDVSLSWKDVASQKSCFASLKMRRRHQTSKIAEISSDLRHKDEEESYEFKYTITHRMNKFNIDAPGKRSTGSGTTFWKPAWDRRNDPASTTLHKKVIIPSTFRGSQRENCSAPTSCDLSIGLSAILLCKSKKINWELSLDKKKRWDYTELNIEDDCDFRIDIGMGINSRFPISNSKHAPNTSSKNFVFMEPETFAYAPSKLDQEMESFFVALDLQRRKIRSKSKRTKNYLSVLHQIKEEECAIPCGLNVPRLPMKLSATSKAKKVRTQSASVSNWHHSSYWAPSTQSDARDFLEIDLLKVCLISALGTKGRADERNRLGEFLVSSHSCKEFVTEYKLFFKRDKDEAWTYSGMYKANVENRKEVVNSLVDPSTKKGLEARYLRIQPTSFHIRKSMRCGVYGVSSITSSNASTQPKKVKHQSSLDLDNVLSKNPTKSCVVYSIVTKHSINTSRKHRFLTNICSSICCANDKRATSHRKRRIWRSEACLSQVES